MLGSTLLRFLLPFTNMKTIGTCLLENIICILVEFRSTINLLVFVNHLYMYLLLLSDIVKLHNLYIYSMMGLLIYKYEPLWQEVSVKSLILRWFKACGPLVFYMIVLINTKLGAGVVPKSRWSLLIFRSHVQRSRSNHCVVHFIYFNPLLTCVGLVLFLQRR